MYQNKLAFKVTYQEDDCRLQGWSNDPKIFDEIENVIEIISNVLTNFGDETSQLLEKKVTKTVLRCANDLFEKNKLLRFIFIYANLAKLGTYIDRVRLNHQTLKTL